MNPPVVRIRVSKNGGQTWSDWRVRDLGKVGEFAKRITFSRFGRARQWVIETSVTDPVRADLIAASVKMKGIG